MTASRWFTALVLGLGVSYLAVLGCARGQGYSAEVAAGKMTVADGFAVKLVAAEPMVRKPVAMM